MEDRKIGFSNNEEPTKEKLASFVRSINFGEETVPKLVESRSNNWVLNGTNHSYVKFLLSLKTKNTIHSAIIDGISQSIAGENITVENKTKNVDAKNEAVEQWLNNINNKGESAHQIIKKLAKDLTIFNYCFIQVSFSPNRKDFQIYHVDASNIATGKVDPETKEIEEFWISNNWSEIRKEINKPVPIQAYNPKKKDLVQLIMLRQYTPGNLYYNEPRYAAANQFILIGESIANFHLSNIKRGMIPSMWCAFNDGKPSEEVEQKLYDDITEAFSGEKNSGKVLITYSKSKENAPEFTPMNPTDADKLFLMLNEQVRQEVLCSHQAPPVLFSIPTPGALGQRNEIMEANEIFNSRVIYPDQILLEEQFTKLAQLKFQDQDLKLVIEDSNPISFSFDPSILATIMTKDELRAMINLDPIAEDESKNKPIALIDKIGIGGTQGLLEILTSALSNEQKINTLVIVFGISIEQAQSMVAVPATTPTTLNEQFKTTLNQ